jgi:hypothetical protein
MSEELNDLLLAEGDDARKEAEKKNSRKKVNYVKLKDGGQLRGFLLTTDFKMYFRHGDFEKGIKSHTCKDPKTGKNCLSCQHGVKRTKSTLVPFFNVDTQQVEVFDASNKAMKVIYAYTDQYEEDSTVTAIALIRSGDDTGTTYSLMPIRVKKAEEALFTVPEGVVIDAEFYMGALNPPDDDYVRKLIGLEAAADEKIESIPDGQTDIKEDDLPF